MLIVYFPTMNYDNLSSQVAIYKGEAKMPDLMVSFQFFFYCKMIAKYSVKHETQVLHALVIDQKNCYYCAESTPALLTVCCTEKEGFYARKFKKQGKLIST